MLILISIWFASLKGASYASAKLQSLTTELLSLSVYAEKTLELKGQCLKIAKDLCKVGNAFVLGKGYGEAIAKEAALKIKEIAYMFAEGLSGGELKHGPLALIEPGTPVFAIVLDDKHSPLMRIACKEVFSRGAHLIVVTDNAKLAEGLKAETILIPKSGVLSALLAVIPFQIIAYYAALEQNINPDRPRNLAKSVTVD